MIQRKTNVQKRESKKKEKKNREKYSYKFRRDESKR